MKSRFCSVLILILCLAGLALAQSDNGRVIGTITDPSGAVLSNATVIATDSGTGHAVTAKTDSSGAYTLNALPPGKYHVTVKAEGFKTAEADITLEVTQVQEFSPKLETGSSTTTVDVTGDVPLVDTATSSTGEVIQGRQVVELPLNGRNFTSLALLTPGVSRGQYSDNASAPNNNAETWRNAESGGAALAVDGLRPQSNNYMMDGIDNNDSLVNTLVIFPAIEDVQEFKTTTSNPPAEFGRSGGGVIQVATKSGTNQIHGAAYWFNRSREGAADTFEPETTPPTAFAPPELSRNQFGASLGGPIWKNKIFAFLDYQGWRQDVPAGIVQAHVPSTLMRTGNFSELLTPGNTATATSVPAYAICPSLYSVGYPNPVVLPQFSAGYGYIYNPQTCLPFGWNGTTATNIIPAGSMIPSSGGQSVGLNYLNAFPNPNIPSANLAANDPNFNAPQQNITHNDDYDARVDFVVTNKDTIFARYSLGDDFLENTPFLVDATHFLPSGNGTNPQHPRQVAVGYTRIISNNIVNEFHYGYERTFYGYQQPDSNVALANQLGIVNANTSPLLGGMPIIGGWYGNMSYVGDGGPYLIKEPTHQFSDSVSWIKGKHVFKFGASVIHRDVDWDQGNDAKGYFWIDDGDYGGMPTPTSAHGTFTGYEESEVLAGFMGAYSVGAFNGYYQTRGWENGFYAQDDWRVTSRLILNLGLRYDLFTWPKEASNHMSNFDPATGELVEAGTPAAAGYNLSLINTPKKNFGPRIGFAYDVHGNGKMVIRGGYGLFYYLDRGGVANELSENPDFNGTQSYYACNSSTLAPGGIDCTGAYNPNSGYRVAFTGQAPIGTTDPTQATAALPAKIGIAPNDVTAADNVVYWPKNSPNSHIQQWNFGIELALDSKTSWKLGYVGNKVGNLATPFNANANYYNGGSPNLTNWFPVGGSVNPLGVGAINEYAMIGHGNYNSLQTQVTRRLSGGLMMTAAYTWAHALDNSADALSTAPNGIVMGPNGVPLLNYQYGSSDNDQRQIFAASAIYELPFGRGKMLGRDMPKSVDYVVGGWQWNNIIVLATGTPMDIQGGSGLNGRPDYSGGCSTHVSWRQWISCSPTSFSDPGTGNIGNLPRNYFPGPGTHTWDTSLTKSINITERVKTEFRAQVYNLTNTPQFQIPDTRYTDGTFGQLNTARLSPTNRQLELALRVSF